MTDNVQNQTKQLEMVYERVVNQALGGYQIIEEQLKAFIGMHFDRTRVLLNKTLHFGFSSDDYKDAALGRLVQVFSKLCSNEPLITELRTTIVRRNHLAHKAFLTLYRTDVLSTEYAALLGELQSDMERISDLIAKINKEVKTLTE
jgi:hypothetical protein